MRTVISALGARCLKTMCSIMPEPPGGPRPSPNQSFQKVHGTTQCGGLQAASRLDLSLHQVFGFAIVTGGWRGPDPCSGCVM